MTDGQQSPRGLSGLAALSREEIEARLRESEETLDAIRNGEVDAVVVGGPAGQQVYTLENADRPYRVLIEQMQEGAVTLNHDGTILYCNQRFATIVDMPWASIIGGSIGRFFDAREGGMILASLSRGSETGSSAEFTLMARQGVEVPVNLSLVTLRAEPETPRVVCGVVTDLTHNRKRSQELTVANKQLAREIEERGRVEASLQLALDAAGMGSWDLDLETHATRHSPRHSQIFGIADPPPGWGPKEAFGQIVAEDRERVSQAFAQAQATGRIECEARIRRVDDGSIRWIQIQGRTYYEGAKAVRIAGVVADVTDRRIIEEQLRQSQKMEAVGQLTGGIAHDFNNILMIIGGSLDMLSRRVPPDEKLTRLFDAARQGVGRGAKLNQQLLAFSRRQDLRAEVVCVDELIPSFEHLLDRSLGETISVKVERAQDTWLCLTDPHQLETAILNLAINARDAMPEGGTLVLATENRTVADSAAEPWGASGGDYVVVLVKDTGTGMPPDIVARVFEPFFTTKAVGKGTGLGLSQVYGFAKQSNGFVMIESEPGQGTTVLLHLPRTRLQRAAAESAEAAEWTDQGRGVILVVEDDAVVLRTTTGMLRDLGYGVVEAASGRIAMTLVERGIAIDAVFTDVIMPDGMSGVDLAREMKRLRPGLPVLLTSGYTAQHLVPDGLMAGLTVLRKPYGLSELARTMRALLGAPASGVA